MTDLESPKKNNDCYFYYYSTCSKGDSCGFRHEPSALGCETTCSFWKEGKCLNVHCNFRHMELRKNRKAIPCYWESQPGGCLKPYCPFLHQNARPTMPENDAKSSACKSETNLTENCNQPSSFKSTPSVDSLVVNFEEESDSESAPATSPAKIGMPKVKTLEEIKLEKIAAACAAYYSYPNETTDNTKQPQILSGDDLRQRILQRVKTKENLSQKTNRKLSRNELAHILGDESLRTEENMNLDTLPPVSDGQPPYKRRKVLDKESVQKIKVKTLAEIRAERSASAQKETLSETIHEKKTRKRSPIRLNRRQLHKINKSDSTEKIIDESEVTSTSNDEPESPLKKQEKLEDIPLKPFRKLNLKNIKSSKLEGSISSYARNAKEENSHQELNEDFMLFEEGTINREKGHKDSGDIEIPELERSDSNKTVDESVLLLDDDLDLNVNLKAEDDLLNEIDDLLNE